jgi:aspartyl-tRNA(Asn)/glutamyl-tRNA(Gln) amidotransferase subunit A
MCAAMSELWSLTAAQLLDGYRRHEFSPVEVTRSVMGRVQALNGKLNAFCSTAS